MVPAPAWERTRHVGKHVAHDPEHRDGSTEILQVDFVERVRLGMVPVEVVLADRTEREPGNTIIH